MNQPDFETPIPAHEIEPRIVELHALLADGSRFIVMPDRGFHLAANAEGMMTGSLDRDAVRWTLCGGVLHVCRDHPRKFTVEEALCEAICLASGIAFMTCGPLTSLEWWEINEGKGRSHQEVMAVLNAALAALYQPSAA